MYRALLDVIEQSPLAPSLRQVARRLGVSVGALRYRFPNEAKQIVRAWDRRSLTAAKRQSARVRNVVSRCIDEWETRGRGPLTKKGVLRVLRTTTGLPKEPLRKEIDSALIALEVRREISQRCMRLGVHDRWNRSHGVSEVADAKGSAEKDFFRALAWMPRSRHPAATAVASDKRARVQHGERSSGGMAK
jgi:AcrR family transcriptional regulator